MSALSRLVKFKNQATRQALENLKIRAPRVYHQLVLKDRVRKSIPKQLGATDWSDLGKDLAEILVSTKALKEVSADERKAAELELKKLNEKNRTVEKQIALLKQQEKLTLAQKATMAGESVLDRIKEIPLAIPALLGLGFMLVRSVGARRRG